MLAILPSNLTFSNSVILCHRMKPATAEGKCFVQLMYEFYTGGFRPVRPAAKVLQFPDPLGHKSERLAAWARAQQLERDCQREREAKAHG